MWRMYGVVVGVEYFVEVKDKRYSVDFYCRLRRKKGWFDHEVGFVYELSRVGQTQ